MAAFLSLKTQLLSDGVLHIISSAMIINTTTPIIFLFTTATYEKDLNQIVVEYTGH